MLVYMFYLIIDDYIDWLINLLNLSFSTDDNIFDTICWNPLYYDGAMQRAVWAGMG